MPILAPVTIYISDFIGLILLIEFFCYVLFLYVLLESEVFTGGDECEPKKYSHDT